MLFYRGSLLQFVRLFPFWARLLFVPMAMYNVASCAVSFRVICWSLITFPCIYFFSLFFIHSSSAPEAVSVVWYPCSFLFLRWSLLLILCPIIGHFIFRILSPVVAPGMVLCTKCILPCKNSRLLLRVSNKVVAFHLDSSTAKAYLCNQSGTPSLFLPD